MATPNVQSFSRQSLAEVDPAVAELLDLETERQTRKLILIPSESCAPLAVQQALGSVFENIYAEGYPPEETRWMSEAEILDYRWRLAEYRRYSDPRYYKGVEYADLVEALARRRAAELFAATAPGFAPEDLYVNVQPLSGAPANLAVYEALLEPGDTVLSMSLIHGGHLSHGAPVSATGRHFHIVHYGVDPKTERLDYEVIEALAREHRPKMIIAGYTSYPYPPDWARFRQIADAVGAYLLADIAHVAGLVVAGAFPTPLGHAHVITFTTHKTLCGPRAAVILTTDRRLARKLDRAVFPGLQGGPHVNKFAAMAVAFKIAQSPEFRALQHQIVANAKALAAGLAEEGLRIPYGGTESHMLLVDCKSVRGPDGTPLSGDLAARILDLAGLVCNRNTIPGDASALKASGIRLGTPWVTQRGMKEPEMRELAAIIAQVLRATTPYRYAGRKGLLLRAKVDFDALEAAKARVAALLPWACQEPSGPPRGYPHFYSLQDTPSVEGPYAGLAVIGGRATAMLDLATTGRVGRLEPGQGQVTWLLEKTGQVMAPAFLFRPGPERDRYHLLLPRDAFGRVATWLRALSDGYVEVDAEDLPAKAPGPVVVEELPQEVVDRLQAQLPRPLAGAEALPSGEADAPPEAAVAGADFTKPTFIGYAGALKGIPSAGRWQALPAFTWEETEEGEMQRTALFETHRAMKAKMVPFAGWEMPVWYSGVLEEHRAVRQAAGLFDVSHMGVFEVAGPDAESFLDLVTANDVAALPVGRAHYSYLLDPTGHVLDDIFVYRLAGDRFMLVVNAANNDKDWAWLNGVLRGAYRISRERPWARFQGEVTLRDLRDPALGAARRVDLALQGPRSREILLALEASEEDRAKIAALPWAGVTQVTLSGFDVIVTRTGYTGERVAFELFLDPDRTPDFWRLLLEVGEPFGLKPIGLGARDSLRTEAGLPLYGHELAGPLDLGPGDAGFASYVKVYKPFFVGRDAFLAHERERKAVVTRFRMNDKGVPMPHPMTAVVDRKGKVVGRVTSCAIDSEGYLLGQAYVDLKYAEEGTPVGILTMPRRKPKEKPLEALEWGDRIVLPSPATILSRFPRRRK